MTGLTTIAIGNAGELGYAGGTFSGVSVGADDILIMYTYAGDGNLDGVIDGGDYGLIDNNVQIPGAFGYAHGDFNLDGVIDGGDYGIIDNNIQAQGAPFSNGGGVSVAEITVVPEPVALLPLCATLSLLKRRHRRNIKGFGR
jgi:hypothetical protein